MKTIDFIKSLEQLNKPFYSIADMEKITGLARESLYVSLKRLVDSGILERMSRGTYRLFTAKAAIEKIASSLYLPNYLSFESALSRYGVLNLVPYTLTFATTRKTRRFTVGGRDIEFRQIKRALFWGYDMQAGMYIAKPEKAFLDLVYFASRGLTSLDSDELDLKKLSMNKVKKLFEKFPGYTRKYLDRIISL
ncbi:MAG: type IV toxin-antitoxin system AbiEi family antitoxin domain-containing protein [Proteobacteria bacterium]|nr:type IV toxin-antitoxin system AbiEi family antitoxin domain-containing protein [Pseudomonadota bacterium]